MSSRFWPVGEPAQADYERLRALALAAEPGDELLAARRFDRPRAGRVDQLADGRA